MPLITISVRTSMSELRFKHLADEVTLVLGNYTAENNRTDDKIFNGIWGKNFSGYVAFIFVINSEEKSS